jgi:hypothetical protein
VETRFKRLGVETKPKRLGTLIKGRIEEASSVGSIKLLIYRSNPAVVETRVDWREAVEIYPAVPKLMIVEVN